MGSCAQLAQALGLHRESHRIIIDPIVREERLNVFWVCYVMDKTISMMVGRSSTLQDFDYDIGLPSSVGEKQMTQALTHSTSNGSGVSSSFSFFVHHIQLAQIISKVYQKLYSAQAIARHTIDSLADAMGELDAELFQWRNDIPAEYRPDHDIEWKNDTFHRHVLHLHLSYYNCMYNIHRSIYSLPSGPVPISYFTPDRPLDILRHNRVYSSAALSIGAARTCLRLIIKVTKDCPGLANMRIW